MTTYALLPNFGAGAQFFDDSGDPLSGGWLYSYDAGSTTPANTWTSHTGGTLNANPIHLDAAGRIPEEIWIDVDKQYKFILKDSVFYQIWEKDYVGVYVPAPYVPPTPTPVLPEFITVWDFLSDAQILAVQNRTFVGDLSAEIQLAIDYVAAQLTTYSERPIGTLFFPAGGYRIESTLIVSSPIYIQGAGQGGEWTAAQTDIRWYGGAAKMIEFGTVGDGLPFYGGGISQLRLDGRAVASHALYIRGARQFEFSDLYLTGATVGALELTNPNTQANPTGLGAFRNIWINQYFTAADGIRIISPTPVTGPSGSTLCLWDDVFIEHTSGSGLYVNGGDNHTWTRFVAFSSDGSTPGIYFAGVDPTNTQSAHTFINAAASAGVRIDSAGDENDAHTFINFDDGDLYPGVSAFYGNGVGRINATTHSGRLFGSFKTHSYRDTIKHDSMMYVDYNAPVLNTQDGTWRANATAVNNAVQPGGAIEIINSGVPNNAASLYSCATLGASGMSQQFNPHLIFTVSPIDVTQSIHRWGFMDSNSNPPTNGIYVEANPAHATYYRMVAMDNTVPTYLDQTINNYANGQVLQWRIEVGVGVASFYVRQSPNRFFRFVGTMTTGLPAVGIYLDTVFQVVGLDGNPRNVFIYDVKQGFLTEQ
jgi:hypothetical protein